MAKGTYRFGFFRAGGVDQVVLSTGEDLAHLDELDQKLWLALSCPTRGLEFDTRTLDLIDSDHDGHIRPAEVLAAVAFARHACRNLDDLFRGEASIKLSAINTDTELGKALHAEAKNILQILGRPEGDSVSLDDIRDIAKIIDATPFNGDGTVPVDSARDEVTRGAMLDILATVGAKVDRSGKPGVDQSLLTTFFEQAQRFVDWLDQGERDHVTTVAGARTEAAADAVTAVAAKIDDYFARCRLAAFDARAAWVLNASEAELVALSTKTLTATAEEIARLPLAPVRPDPRLTFAEGLNPAWKGRMETLAKDAVEPLLGPGHAELTEAAWTTIKDRLAPYHAWQSRRPATPVAALPAGRLRGLLAGRARDLVAALIAEDAAAGDLNQRIEQVEKMIRLHRDLVRLLRNFVNFSELYGTRKAIFQTGTLYIDGRSCDLCLPVDDTGKHASLAGQARAYLLYCDCTRKGAEKRSIVAAVTNGDTDNLMVGRNGVFWDRKGQDWDATVTRIVENPIGIGQAFWSPYKSFVRLVEEQMAKRIADADRDAKQKVHAAASETAHADRTSPDAEAARDPKKAPPAKKIDVGTVAALGVAVGGIATFVSSILAMFFGLGFWMPVGFLGLVLAISGRSMLLAWLKLRQRNIGPILDANGWSVNALAKINVPFGAALTKVATLPRGSRRELHDPFAEKRRPWKLYVVLSLILVLALAWYLGRLDRHLPGHMRACEVLGRECVLEIHAPLPVVPITPAAPKP